MKEKKRLFIKNSQAPGDVLLLTAACRDLMQTYSDRFELNVHTTAQCIWDNNPYLNSDIKQFNADLTIKAGYPLIHKSNKHPWHFIHGFRQHLENQLSLPIPQGEFKGDIHISDLEKSWISQIHEITKQDLKFWIICAGTKKDFTAKMWEFIRFQEVVDYFKDRILFVQVGELGHGHPGLKNVIDLRGKTDTRQLIRLMYHSCGVLSGVTFLMHLAAAVETRLDRCWKTRPAVVVAGGREPAQWEAYPFHQYLHRCSSLSCCDWGGCWKSRVKKLPDNDKEKNESLCLFPTKSESGQIIPKCLDMITTNDVVRAIEVYEEGYNLENKSFKNENFNIDEFLEKNPNYNSMINGNDINNCKWMKDVFPSSALESK